MKLLGRTNPDLGQKLEDFIQKNPGMSLTLIMNHALESWLKKPSLNLKHTSFSEDDASQFMDEHKKLMHNLSGEHPANRTDSRPSRRVKP